MRPRRVCGHRRLKNRHAPSPSPTTVKPFDACTAVPPIAGIPWVALITRNQCDFYTKALHAQMAGAMAAIIGNDEVGGAPIGMDSNQSMFCTLYHVPTRPLYAALLFAVFLLARGVKVKQDRNESMFPRITTPPLSAALLFAGLSSFSCACGAKVQF